MFYFYYSYRWCHTLEGDWDYCGQVFPSEGTLYGDHASTEGWQCKGKCRSTFKDGDAECEAHTPKTQFGR